MTDELAIEESRTERTRYRAEHHKHNGISSDEIAAIINAEFELYRQRVLVARDDGRDEQGGEGA